LRLRDLRAKKAAGKMLMKLTPEDFPHHRLIGLPSISPTLNERIFCANVTPAAFSTYT